MCTKGQCNSDSFWQCWIRRELREGKELNPRRQLSPLVLKLYAGCKPPVGFSFKLEVTDATVVAVFVY